MVIGATTAVGIATTVDTLSNSNHAKNSVFNSTKKEIEEAADDIPNKLKKEDDDYSVDTSKFNQKVRGKSDLKEPKTGWVLKKSHTQHKSGEKWKLYNNRDERIATLTGEGKIIGG